VSSPAALPQQVLPTCGDTKELGGKAFVCPPGTTFDEHSVNFWPPRPDVCCTVSSPGGHASNISNGWAPVRPQCGTDTRCNTCQHTTTASVGRTLPTFLICQWMKWLDSQADIVLRGAALTEPFTTYVSNLPCRAPSLLKSPSLSRNPWSCPSLPPRSPWSSLHHPPRSQPVTPRTQQVIPRTCRSPSPCCQQTHSLTSCPRCPLHSPRLVG
jgi:hypothetical protein